MTIDELMPYIGKNVTLEFKDRAGLFDGKLKIQTPTATQFVLVDREGGIYEQFYSRDVHAVKWVFDEDEERGEQSEQETKSRRLQSLLKPSIYNGIKERADKDGQSVNDKINCILAEYLSRTETPDAEPKSFIKFTNARIRASEIAVVGNFTTDRKTVVKIELKNGSVYFPDSSLEAVMAKIAEVEQ